MAGGFLTVRRSTPLFIVVLLTSGMLLCVFAARASALPERFFGMTAQESMNDSEPDWEALQNAGVQRFRMQIKWANLASNWKEEAGWVNTYDRYFEKAAKHGIAILPFIYGRKDGNQAYYIVGGSAEYTEWLQFVYTAVHRYGQSGTFWASHPALPQYPVSTWEVWNEPNLNVNCPGGQIDGETYGKFLSATSHTIREAQPGAKVLFGGLYEERWNYLVEGYEGIYKYMAQASKVSGISSAYDGLSIHPYALGQPGETVRSYPEKASGFQTDVNEAYYAQLKSIGAKPLWVTEFGWPVSGNNSQHVLLSEQGSLLTDSYNWMKANQAVYNIQFGASYLYRDVTDDPNTKWDFHAGLRAVDGLWRPSWFAYEAQTGVAKWPADVPSAWPSDSLSGVIAGDPDIASWGKERLDVMVRGLDSGLLDKHYTGGVGWSGWEEVPGSAGKLAGGPSAVSWADGRLDVVARGISGQVLHWSWDKSDPKWYFDESLGGEIQGDPSISSMGPNRLDLFARGKENRLWHRWYDASAGGWGPWELLPNGVLAGGPSSVSWGNGRVDVVARGTSGQILHWSWDKSNPTQWYFDEAIGGNIISDPDISSWGTGRLDIFVRGTDFRLYHKAYSSATGWSSWSGLGGSLLGGGLGAVSWGPNRIDVVGRAYDDSVYHTAYTGP